MIEHICNFNFDGTENIKNFLKDHHEILYSEHPLLSGGVSTYSRAAHLFRDKFFEDFSNKLVSLTNKVPIEMWSNIGYPGTYVKPHNHYSEKYSDSISGVYYLQKPKNSGNLVIEGDVIDVTTGDLVIFKDTEMHWTEKNNSEEDRVVISFNLY